MFVVAVVLLAGLSVLALNWQQQTNAAQRIYATDCRLNQYITVRDDFGDTFCLDWRTKTVISRLLPDEGK